MLQLVTCVILIAVFREDDGRAVVGQRLDGARVRGSVCGPC